MEESLGVVWHFLNINKTIDIVIKFQKTFQPAFSTVIKGSIVDKVDCTKYLGKVVNMNFNYDLNTTAFCKKGLQRLFFGGD